MYEAEGEYKFDNPDLEYKTKRQKKTQALEQKYKDKPKIAFHKLTEEGIAPNFCPGSGYDSSTRQPTFTVGVQGVTMNDFTNSEKVIF